MIVLGLIARAGAIASVYSLEVLIARSLSQRRLRMPRHIQPRTQCLEVRLLPEGVECGVHADESHIR
jgi:hypothetical protein